jgi:hypothetical protein
MRTEEEAKYEINERIYELYDAGIPVDVIAGQLKTEIGYVVSVLNGVQVEAS